MIRGDARLGASGRENGLARRLRVGAAGSIVVGGAIFLGGAASLVTAFAHSGVVTTSQSCTTWSASVSLNPDVTTDRWIEVDSTIPGHPGVGPITNQVPGPFWSATGASPQSGTVSLKIFTPGPGANTVPGPLEFGPPGSGATTESADAISSLVAPTGCTSAISTTPSAGGVVGTAIHDSATVTGTLGSPAGSVVFALFPPSNATCSATGTPAVLTSSAISLTSASAGVSNATSPNFTTNAVGVYHWVAAYTPAIGSPYKGATSNCADEAVTTSQGGPTIATTASAGGQVPVLVSDSATVSGGVSPTGTVTFTLYPSTAACTAGTGALYTSPAETLSGGKATSGTFNATTAGTYQWIAKYSGDTNNAAATSTCGAEPVTTTTGGGGVQAITTPGTGGTGSLTGITVGGFLLLGGLAFALMGVLVPRRRNDQ